LTSISVASGKGGTGKTTLTLNIGATLALQDREVVLVDGDFMNRSLTVLCDLMQQPRGFADLLFDPEVEIGELIYNFTSLKKLRLIPSASTSLDLFSRIEDLLQNKKDRLVNRMKEIADCAECVLIDTPAGISDGVLLAISTAEKFCIVTETGEAELESALLTNSFARSVGLESCGVILNKLRGPPPKEFLARCESIFGKIIGEIPFDIRFINAFQEKSIFCMTYPDAPSSKAIRDIAEELFPT
jgi:septum site-determining protein MinD